MLPQMPREVLQDRVRLAVGIHTPRQTVAQALNGPVNSPDTLLCRVLAAPRIFAQELLDLLPLPPLPARFAGCP